MSLVVRISIESGHTAHKNRRLGDEQLDDGIGHDKIRIRDMETDSGAMYFTWPDTKVSPIPSSN